MMRDVSAVPMVPTNEETPMCLTTPGWMRRRACHAEIRNRRCQSSMPKLCDSISMAGCSRRMPRASAHVSTTLASD